MLSLLLSLVLLADPEAGPSNGEPFQTYVLETSQNVWDVAVEDVNGDGMGDILVLCCNETSYPLEKSLHVFLGDASKGYAKAPSSLLELEPKVSALFLAEVDGATPKELVTVDTSGATVYAYKGDAFEVIAEAPFVSLIPSGSKEPLFLEKAAMDLDGDKVDEWLIPVATGYDVRNADGLIASVTCDVVSEMHRMDSTYITHRLPSYHAFSLDGVTTKGLAFLSDEFADFSFGDGWSEHKRFRIPVNLEEKWDASSKMVDIDKNGLPDLVITQTKGTVNMQSQTQIYLAEAPFTYPETPSTKLLARGALMSPLFEDVDGDERLDMIVLSIHIGLKFFVNLFLRGKLSVNGEVYLCTDNGFDQDPTFKTSMTIPVPEGREQVSHATGDFTGDGRLDIAFGHAEDKIAVYAGEEDRFMSAKPWAVVAIPGLGIATEAKLDANAAEDIVIFHPGGENGKRVDVIVF